MSSSRRRKAEELRRENSIDSYRCYIVNISVFDTELFLALYTSFLFFSFDVLPVSRIIELIFFVLVAHDFKKKNNNKLQLNIFARD